jgi:hypothetical protein
MNPMDVAQQVANIPQRHFVGSADKVVPSFIVRSFIDKLADQSNVQIVIVQGATHNSGWSERWPKLLSE